MVLYILFESAPGVGLFECSNYEDLAKNKQEYAKAMNDFKLFSRMIKLSAFHAFADMEEVLEYQMAVVKAEVPPMLQNFLMTAVPETSKSKKVVIGVPDKTFSGAINETLGYPVRSDDLVVGLSFGIRQHFSRLVRSEEVDSKELRHLQIGLGHAFSRNKVKFNAVRADQMVTQAIALLDQMAPIINQASMRAREWYSHHFPELAEVLPQSIAFCRAASVIGNKDAFVAEMREDRDGCVKRIADALLLVKTHDEATDAKGAENLTGCVTSADAATAKAELIADCAKRSMGPKYDEADTEMVMEVVNRAVGLEEYRDSLEEYIALRMRQIAPNFTELVGDKVGARLIAKAGSIKKLATAPASTLQVLGAEKALFHALKKNSRTPKYGYIYHSSAVSGVDTRNKGRIARSLASKAALAVRIDAFRPEESVSSNIYGCALRDLLDQRVKFLTGVGPAPESHVDLLTKVAAEQAKLDAAQAGETKADEAVEEPAAGDARPPAEDVETDEAPVKRKKSKKEKKKSKKDKKKSSKKH